RTPPSQGGGTGSNPVGAAIEHAPQPSGIKVHKWTPEIHYVGIALESVPVRQTINGEISNEDGF
ncbi:MAG: hypothetical protein NWR88_04450, partial [Ilumatobacteraceae bacterium]|nr:hypothetical protein [Ilumatobacteraceae bacterium]